MDRTSNISASSQTLVKIATTAKEKEEAFKIRRKVFVDEQQVPEELELDEFDLLDTTVHFIVYAGEEPVGAARLREYTPSVAKAERVAVLQERRGTGMGAVLMNALEQTSKAMGMREVKLNAQLSAEPFYLNLGYNKTSDVFMDAGIEHVAMKKELD
jgi:predicted GNAT family N-acyltransferase